MSDRRDDHPEDEKLKRQESGDDRTKIRGQETAAQEGNDDATVLRSNYVAPDAAPNDDATVLRSSDPAPQSIPNDDATVLRPRDAAAPSVSGDDATVLRSRDVSEPAAAGDDATVLRDPGPEKGGRSADGSRPGTADSRADDNSDSATILHGPAGDAGEATILRGPSDDDSATILRGPSDDDSATILRGPAADDGDSATILRGGGADDAGDDATVMRGGGVDDDDDRTVINDNYDDDSTVLGAGSSGQDTTYIASVGKQVRPQGNSEAGRLLKNRFVLEEKIGSGGMGDVYKALDLRQQEAQERDPYIAIKLLNENFARHKDAFLSLQRETSRTRGIPHPNIMAVYDFDREGDTVFMSMELLDGKPLDDYLKEHPEGVSEEDAWTIIDGICKGLMRAHDAGIVHSDFKPGNIFYTRDKTAKVFDFGIARAVSGDLEADGEKTVFDAGSLGALTPTYASYEMLKGLEPSKSDDVYAVALVAYELFMGKHPYDRVPADKALERGLKPKPVPFLKRRHWKALKKALEIKGENRTQTIDEFYEGVFSEDPPYFRYSAIAAVLIASIGFGVYQSTNVKEMPEDLARYHNVMEGAKNNITSSLRDVADNPSLWEEDVWHDQLATSLTRWKATEIIVQENKEWMEEFPYEHDDDIEKLTASILGHYLDRINLLRQQAANYAEGEHPEFGVRQAIELLSEADGLMNRVEKNYASADPQEVAQIDQQLQVRLKLRRDKRDEIDAENLRNEQIAAENARLEAERLAREKFDRERLADYNGYLATIDDILKCKGDVADEELVTFNETLGRMKSRWPEAYEYHYPKIVGYMATCIGQRIGLVKPDRAREVQSRVVSYLPDATEIANLVIEDKDPCDERGLVGRGDRNLGWCSDRLPLGGEGPELVVIPPENDLKDRKYAISRSEIRVGDFNRFCQQTGCNPPWDEKYSPSLPATNISLEQARAFTRWLSSQTGETYRLPTVKEWDWAVRSIGTRNENFIDENINCTVDSRGVRLGENLVNAISGRPNPWGLYNYLGNAREWAVAEDGTLLALGGAHTDPRQECTLEKRVVHSGEADRVTGFRVLREIEDKSEKPKEGTDLAVSS